MKKIINRIIVCFGVIVLFLVIMAGEFESLKEANYWFDACDYWARGRELWNEGKFSFLNLGNAFRGYIFPLYLGLCYFVGGDSQGALIFVLLNSLLLSILFVVVLPRLHEAEEKKQKYFWVHLILFLVMFYGLVRHTLSDLFAVELCMFAILLEKNIYVSNSKIKRILKCFLLGILMYWMYNARTIYLFAAIYIFGVFLYHTKYVNGIKAKFDKVIACIIGIGIAGLPQLYVNYSTFPADISK